MNKYEVYICKYEDVVLSNTHNLNRGSARMCRIFSKWLDNL